MTALAVACRYEVPMMWQPDPVRQTHADYTVEDVLNLPEDAPRVELVDGVMVVVPSPSIGHQNIGNLLWSWLYRNAPKTFLPVTAIGVMVSPKDTFEPDLVLVKQQRPGTVDTKRHYLSPDEVAIVVEVVSPGTGQRDRYLKPGGYADAGIPYFWRIEQDPRVRVFAYRLSDDGIYDLMAQSTELLEISEPFEIKLQIAEITP
jgi:Uma2 family endonuclease